MQYTRDRKGRGEADMGTEKTADKPSIAVAMLGMALFWPFFTHPVYPSELLTGAHCPTSAAFLTLFFAASVVCALLVALRCRLGKPPCGLLLPNAVAPGAGTLYVVLLALSAALHGTAPSMATAWASPLVLAVLMASLSARWASTVVSFEPRMRALILTSSLALSTVFSIVAQDIGAVAGVSEATATQTLPLVSAFLTPLANASDAMQTHCRATGERAKTLCPPPSRTAARWLVMVGSLFLFLLGSGVFRSAFTAYAGYEGVTQEWAHRIMLIALAGLLVGWALLCRRRAAREPYPWLAFLVVCLVALYCGVVFYPLFATFANEVMLPTRPVAILLMWVATVQFALSSHGSPAVSAVCLFLPFETLIRVATAWLGDSFWAMEGSSLFLEIMMLVTALSLTLGMVAWLLLGMKGLRQGSPDDADSKPGTDASLVTLRKRYGLSERETEVMALLARGYTQKRIAEELSVSINSVQTYAKTLYRKLDVHSRQEIIDLVALPKTTEI